MLLEVELLIVNLQKVKKTLFLPRIGSGVMDKLKRKMISQMALFG